MKVMIVIMGGYNTCPIMMDLFDSLDSNLTSVRNWKIEKLTLGVNFWFFLILHKHFGSAKAIYYVKMLPQYLFHIKS